MAKQVKFINDITTTTKQPWTVKAMVLERGFPREPQSSPKKFQRLIITDSQGTWAQVTIFGRDIDLFEGNLLAYKSYYISNATIRTIKPRHRIVEHQYQWILNARSLVEEALNDQSIAHPQSSDFVSFSRLADYKDSTTEVVDIIAIALELLPTKERTTKYGLSRIQEMIIINDELKPIILTMWNQFLDNEAVALSQVIAKKPVIVGKRLKVGSYNGISLSTKSSSSISIAPDISETQKLQSWLSNNITAIEAFMDSQTFKAFHEPSDGLPLEDLTYIESLATLPDNRNYSLKCTLSVVDLHKIFWYMSCSNCHKATSATYNQLFTCNHCKRRNVSGIPRCRVQVDATDSTSTISATLFGEDAERFLSCKALTLMENLNEEKEKEINSMIKTQSDGEVAVQLKAYHYDLQGDSKRRFNLSFADIIVEAPQLESSTSQQCTDEKEACLAVEVQAAALPKLETKTPILDEGVPSKAS